MSYTKAEIPSIVSSSVSSSILLAMGSQSCHIHKLSMQGSSLLVILILLFSWYLGWRYIGNGCMVPGCYVSTSHTMSV